MLIVFKKRPESVVEAGDGLVELHQHCVHVAQRVVTHLQKHHHLHLHLHHPSRCRPSHNHDNRHQGALLILLDHGRLPPRAPVNKNVESTVKSFESGEKSFESGEKSFESGVKSFELGRKTLAASSGSRDWWSTFAKLKKRSQKHKREMEKMMTAMMMMMMMTMMMMRMRMTTMI